MSVKCSSWVWEHSRATGTARLVLLALADTAHDDGRCWPGVESVARKCRVSASTVKRAVTTLVEIGELAVTDRGKQTNLYLLTLSCGLNLTPQKPALVGSSGSLVGSSCTLVGSPVTPKPLENRKRTIRSDGSRSKEHATELAPILRATLPRCSPLFARALRDIAGRTASAQHREPGEEG